MGKVAMSSLYITLTLKIKFKLKKCLHLMKIEVDGTKLLLGPLQMGHSRNSKKSSSFRTRSCILLVQYKNNETKTESKPEAGYLLF